ncbi:hypothetical protein ACIBSV_22660 [Embleya sp. NPDC050154]|uniref:hypothetical protein n=1 Tax=Embleya sp. NPDC050154 TaxID=3363988 RepID=UPI00378ED4AA
MSPYSQDRLPGHERRRRELLAILDTGETSRGRALMPGVAAGAVLAVCAAGILAAQPWQGPQDLSPAGPVAGQDPIRGVPQDAAKPGDPVPWDVATRALNSCLELGRRAAVPPPPPTGFDPGGPTMPPPGARAPGSAPPSIGHTLPPGTPLGADAGDLPAHTPGNAAGPYGPPPQSPPTAVSWTPTGWNVPPTSTPRPTDTATAPDRQVWKVREPDAAFRPYFTAWEHDAASGLRPFVLGKADKPDLVVCHGEKSPPELPAPTAADGILAGAFEVRRTQVMLLPGAQPLPLDPAAAEPLPMVAPTPTTWWGRTTGAVARVVVELPDGKTVGAVVRNGVWLATVPGNDTAPARIRAYDAAGALLHERVADAESLRCAQAPMTKSCGSRTRWG